jgi:UDPglucose 6-dehydrogenase
MNITVSGAGYVGLVTAVCLSEVGNNVVCLDVDELKIEKLKEGKLPIHEAGLEDLLLKNIDAGRISFTSDIKKSILHGDVHFIAVGTPPNEDGSANLSYVHSVAENIGNQAEKPIIVVNKSTVPVGTADTVEEIINTKLTERGKDFFCPVASNPEFLKEGAAIDDFMKPDRIIIGSNNKYAVKILREVYAPFNRSHDKLITMDSRSAELSKYAANAMLATRISLMNELSGIAENMGADIEKIRIGIGSDTRIGYDFLYAGCGYGGSCFPKDVLALIDIAENKLDLDADLLKAVHKTNESQKMVLVDKVRTRFGEDLSGIKLAIWGLAFKPNTDDMRFAPSINIIESLLKKGAIISAYDPIAQNSAKSILNDSNLTFEDSCISACKDADAIIIVTEWKEFRSLDLDLLKGFLKTNVIFDGRNLYNIDDPKLKDFEYYSIGRPPIK